MRNWYLIEPISRLRVGAVSYLNTVPLVWGMLHGAEREQVDLSFSIPSVCAQQLQANEIQVGLVPIAEVARQNLEIISGVGITCFGPVRSILLFSRTPLNRIRTLAADRSSRTSVELARIILRERFGIEPAISSHAPALNDMLKSSDAALLIGDPALTIEPASTPFGYLDLGAEWQALTGLPMVFAAWACKPGNNSDSWADLMVRSYDYGAARIDEIVNQEYNNRGISRELADRYLRQHIRYRIDAKEQRGMEVFLELARLEYPALAANN